MAFTGHTPGTGGAVLLAVDTATREQREVAPEGASELAWSPDGERLAWIGWDDVTGGGTARVAGLDDEVSDLPGGGDVRGLAWAGDGTLALLRRPAAGGLPEQDCAFPDARRAIRLEVVLRSTDGSERVLTTAAPTARELTWSPDARTLLWTESGPDVCTGVDSQVFLADVGSGAVRQVSGESQRAGGAQFTPDSRTVVLSKSDGLGADLVLVDVASATSRRLLTPGVFELRHALSPDGTRVAVERWAEEDRESRIVLLDLEAHVVRDVAPAFDLTDAIAWSPDGTFLAVAGSITTPWCEGPSCDVAGADPAVWRVGLDGRVDVLSEDGSLGTDQLAFAPWWPAGPSAQRRERLVNSGHLGIGR
ncbi:TolB family protein [Kineococcus sp. SYSU DK004]|uniref:TolB family protein n=1 Tax=Kineococcus sp. SYSU DK004 TaxID=3383125 RepID=UPI003D7F01DC